MLTILDDTKTIAMFQRTAAAGCKEFLQNNPLPDLADLEL